MDRNDQEQAASQPLVAEDRRRRIAQLIRDTGSVTVTALEAEFDISASTARRDLAILERAGQAKRTHGGAVFPGPTGHEDSFEQRLTEAVPAKKRLAEAALGLLEPDETVFIDSSTTAYYALQRILSDSPHALFLTNLLPAMELFKSIETPNAQLIGIGGSFKELTKSFVGAHAAQMVRAFLADKMFLSVKGLTLDGDLTDPDPSEAEVKRAMIDRAENPILLVDGRKFERRGLSVITHVSDVSLVIAADTRRSYLDHLSDLGVALQCP